MAREQQLVTARLPIPETMSRSNKDQGSHVHLPLDIGTVVITKINDHYWMSLSYSCRGTDDCVLWD